MTKVKNQENNLASDKVLEKIICEIPKPEIKSTNNVFHDLISCILEQQIHYRSTKNIFQKMLNASGLERLTPDNFHQFEENSFGNIKLSIRKYETVLRVLEFWVENNIDWFLLTDLEVIEKLTSIKGIGRWTIDMILLYSLNRTNIIPYDDYHLKQVMVSLYNLNPKVKLKAQMLEISENWEGQKSLAVLYLLAWKQHNKGK